MPATRGPVKRPRDWPALSIHRRKLSAASARRINACGRTGGGPQAIGFVGRCKLRFAMGAGLAELRISGGNSSMQCRLCRATRFAVAQRDKIGDCVRRPTTAAIRASISAMTPFMRAVALGSSVNRRERCRWSGRLRRPVISSSNTIAELSTTTWRPELHRDPGQGCKFHTSQRPNVLRIKRRNRWRSTAPGRHLALDRSSWRMSNNGSTLRPARTRPLDQNRA